MIYSSSKEWLDFHAIKDFKDCKISSVLSISFTKLSPGTFADPAIAISYDCAIKQFAQDWSKWSLPK